MLPKLPDYILDTKHYSLQGDAWITYDKCSEIPDDIFDLTLTKHEAVDILEHLGAIGQNVHTSTKPIHLLALKIIRKCIEDHGEVFPVLYRGTSSLRPINEYKLLYGSPNIDIARFYKGPDGYIQVFRDVLGFRVSTRLKSVITNDWSQIDENVMFFPWGL